MTYLFIILFSMIAIIAFNGIFTMSIYSLSPLYIIGAVVISTVVEIALSGIVAFIVRWLLPKKWFSIDKKIYVASKKESVFYDKLAIKKWKDKVLELGGFTNFHKNKVLEPKNNEYIGRFIVEANYGVLIHAISVVVGFLVIFIYPLKYWFMFGLPVAIVGAALNILPTIILRYNLTKLHTLYRFNEKREKSCENKTTSDLEAIAKVC